MALAFFFFCRADVRGGVAITIAGLGLGLGDAAAGRGRTEAARGAGGLVAARVADAPCQVALLRALSRLS